MGQLQDVHDSLIELGYQMVFISPDRPKAIKATLEKRKFNYTLLSDSTAEASKAFGVAWHMDEATRKRYLNFGIDLEESSGETHHNLPVPSVFIFDKKGKVRFTYVDPDYRVRIAPDLLLAAAKAVR